MYFIEYKRTYMKYMTTMMFIMSTHHHICVYKWIYVCKTCVLNMEKALKIYFKHMKSSFIVLFSINSAVESIIKYIRMVKSHNVHFFILYFVTARAQYLSARILKCKLINWAEIMENLEENNFLGNKYTK